MKNLMPNYSLDSAISDSTNARFTVNEWIYKPKPMIHISFAFDLEDKNKKLPTRIELIDEE